MRLDRKTFGSGNIFDSKKESDFYSKLSFEEKSKIFAYLQSVAYNYELSKPPRLDRKIHSFR